jgi:hypothetical protein
MVMDEQTAQQGGGERSRAIATRRQAAAANRPRDYSYLEETPVYASTGVHRVDFGTSGKYWIEIQEELDYEQQTILDNASVIGVQREQMESTAEAGQTVRLDLARQRFLLCAVWITRWSVPKDRRGNEIRWPRHINDRILAVKRLNRKWGDAITQVITEYVAKQQEEEEAAQADADDALQFMDEDEGEDDSPPQPTANGEYDDDVQSSHSSTTPVGLSSN